MNKRLAALTAAFVLTTGGYLYASPYITLLMLRNGIEAKSSKDIERLIDFADVRDSLRSQLVNYLHEQASKDRGNSGLSQFTAGVGSAIGGSFIDTMVQPNNLQKWLDGERMSSVSEDANIQSLSEALKGNSSVTMSYKSFDTFNVTFGSSGLLQSVRLERRNVFVWRVVAINVNLSALLEGIDKAPAKQSMANADSLHGDTALSCEDTVDLVDKDLKRRLQTNRNYVERYGPQKRNLYLHLHWTGMNDSSRVDHLFNDEASMISYAMKILRSCKNVDTVTFDERALDGRDVTYEIVEPNQPRRCRRFSYGRDALPLCNVPIE